MPRLTEDALLPALPLTQVVSLSADGARVIINGRVFDVSCRIEEVNRTETHVRVRLRGPITWSRV